MKPKATVVPATNSEAKLFPGGQYLRLPPELLPEKFDRANLRFEVVLLDKHQKLLHLKPLVGGDNSPTIAFVLKAWFTNKGGISPHIAASRLISSLGLEALRKAHAYPATVKGDAPGTIVISFA